MYKTTLGNHLNNKIKQQRLLNKYNHKNKYKTTTPKIVEQKEIIGLKKE